MIVSLLYLPLLCVPSWLKLSAFSYRNSIMNRTTCDTMKKCITFTIKRQCSFCHVRIQIPLISSLLTTTLSIKWGLSFDSHMWETSFAQQVMCQSIKLLQPLHFSEMCLDPARNTGVMYICVRGAVPIDWYYLFSFYSMSVLKF